MGKILIVNAKYYNEISDNLLEGAIDELQRYKLEYDIIEVPGAFEVPAAIVFAIMNDSQKYDGYIALGCVIKGETDHYHYISDAVVNSLSEISIQYVVPLGFGIITANNMDQALKRSDKKQKNVGGSAANAVVKMLNLSKQLLSENND